MRNRSDIIACSAVLGLLLIYASGYLWFRHRYAAQRLTVINNSSTGNKFVYGWTLRVPEEDGSGQVLHRVFLPAMWADARLTGIRYRDEYKNDKGVMVREYDSGEIEVDIKAFKPTAEEAAGGDAE